MQQAITPMQARSHAQCVQRDRSAQTRMALGSSTVWLGPIPWQDPPCAQTVQQDTLVLRQTVIPSLPVPQAPIPLGSRALVLPALLEGQSHMYSFAESKKYCLVCVQLFEAEKVAVNVLTTTMMLDYLSSLFGQNFMGC